MASEVDLWERLERSLELQRRPAAAEGQKDKEVDQDAQRRKAVRRRRIIRALDLLSLTLWLYWLTKLFVVDVDEVALDAVAPGAGGVLDYRLFAYLALLLVGLLTIGRRLLLVIGYVLFFPLILFVWKVPSFFIQKKSWTLLLASTQAVVTFLGGFRYNFISKSIALFAALLVVVSETNALLVISATYITGLMLWSVARFVRKAFAPPSFISVQQQQIDRLVESKALERMTRVDEELLRSDIEIYSEQQMNQLMLNISAGIFINRTLYFWAYQLDRYRRNFAPALVFNGVSYVWLLLGLLMGFAFVNYAILKVDPGQYEVTGNEMPSLLAAMLYSLATFTFQQEAGGVAANGEAAYAMQLIAGLISLLVFTTFLLNIVLTVRRERDEKAMKEFVADLKQRARAEEARFKEQFEVDVDEARRRLEELASGFAWLLSYVTAKIPEEFLREEQYERSGH